MHNILKIFRITTILDRTALPNDCLFSVHHWLKLGAADCKRASSMSINACKMQDCCISASIVALFVWIQIFNCS